MKSVMRIVSRYMLSAAGVALTLLLVNLIVLFAWGIHLINISPKNYRVSQIAAGLSESSDDVYVLSEDAKIMIEEQYQWAMLLNDEGDVVWSENLPEDVPLQYTAAEVASFTRWYLEDYPVHVWQHLDKLFVVGGEENTVWKYSLEYPLVVMNHIFPWTFVALVINALLAMLIALVFGLRLSRSLKPLAKGIKKMAERKAVHLSTKGLLGDFAEDINKASFYLEEQNVALAKRDDARSNWIEGVSHDIRTPLSIVMGYASELEHDPDLPQTRKKQAGIIRQQSERIKTLVNDLNLASKLEYDMQPLREDVFSLAALVRHVAADFLNSIHSDDYPIEVRINEKVKNANIVGDEELLRRAISNLLTNSIKHNPDGCGIKIKLNEERDHYTIRVVDDGIGFPVEMITTLNHPGSSSDLHNHGLGLNLVRQIMKVHSGFAEFRNHPEGGCEVVLWLPCVNTEQE